MCAALLSFAAAEFPIGTLSAGVPTACLKIAKTRRALFKPQL
jgi:hypothetical protein